ncbi:MAG: ATP-binding protein [Armatimonadota bacterium]
MDNEAFMGQNGINDKVNILIVEDSLTQAQVLKDILVENGFKADVAHNGAEALEFLKKQKPQLVISDIVMPQMDGYELCSHIKNNDELRSIPVILLTSLSGINDVIKGLEAGADNFIIKPYEPEYLLTRINHILRNLPSGDIKKPKETVEVFFGGQKYFVASKPHQILDFLLSTYEEAVKKNLELVRAQEELVKMNASLEEINENLEKEIVIRRLAEKDLKHSNEELERFAYVVSHDLQQPLLAVISYLKFLIDECSNKTVKEVEPHIERALTGASRLQNLIKGLLAYSKTGKGKESFKEVNMNNVMETVLLNLDLPIQEHKAKVLYKDLPEVLGNELHLMQILQNIISNSIKFQGENSPEITVKAEKEDDGWLFSVKDNGIGFQQDHAELAFTIFQRLHEDREYPGMGIGLAICKKLVELHGGHIWMESKPGTGTTVYFTLPYDHFELYINT